LLALLGEFVRHSGLAPGWPVATTAASISGATRFFRIGLRRDIS